MSWKFLRAVTEGEPLEIEGVNVWDQVWRPVPDTWAEISDPIYGQRYRFQVWEMPEASLTIRFAAGEFSGGTWGFYLEDRTSP